MPKQPQAPRVPTVNTRVHGLYCGMVKRFAPKNWKSGKRVGTLRDPGQQVPFSEVDLRAWLQSQFPLNCCRSCPYCGTPIDIMSCSIDHGHPTSRGGALGLSNLEVICEACNRLKGGLLPGEFKELMDWIHRQPPAAQQDVLGRLKAGAMGIRLRYINRAALGR